MLHASPFTNVYRNQLTPTWRVIVQIEMGGVGYWLYRRRASLGMPSKRVARFRGAYGALRTSRDGAYGRRRTTPQGQLNTLVHWARWTVGQQLTLRRHQARPKPRLGSLCVVSCSERARARNAPGTGQHPPRRARNSAAFSLAMSARPTPASVCQRE